MATDTRRKYGRRPPKNWPALSLRPSLKTLNTLDITFPATEDYLASLNGGWEMLGNDEAGDCNAVTWANERRLVTAKLTKEYYPSQNQVWEFYQTQNPGFDPTGGSKTNGPGSSHDQGMDIQTGLEYLHSHGGPDGVKAVAFAKINHTNMDEVHAALAIFGSLWLGINVLDNNQDQFSEGVAWSKTPGASIEGGHAILGGGYIPDIRFVTWGEETEFDPSFWLGVEQGQPLVEEVWVVVWPEHFASASFMQNVDITQLAADYHTLTGKILTVPAKPPVPEPTPAGSGVSFQVSDAVGAEVNSRAAKAHPVETGDDWLEKHLSKYFKMD